MSPRVHTTSSERRRAIALAFVGLLALVPASARADSDEQKAVQLFEKGRKLARDGRCAEAIAPLQESLRYAEGVGPLLNLGNCFETLGKSASAHRAFLRAQEVAQKNDDRRRDEARERARAVEKDVSTLNIHVAVSIKSTAELRVDGEPWPRERWDVPWPIDAGQHEIEVIAPPHPKQIESITVHGRGEKATFTANAAAGPAEPPPQRPTTRMPEQPRPADEDDTGSSQRTLGLVSGGFGAAGLVAGTIFGVISLSAHSSLVGRCPRYPTCNVADKSALDDMNANAQSAGTISTISVIAGLALVAAGAALYFTAPSPRAKAR